MSAELNDTSGGKPSTAAMSATTAWSLPGRSAPSTASRSVAGKTIARISLMAWSRMRMASSM
ncbi:hypothetical protein ACFPM0_25445 [Pseudonocardia sulfidoxydans]|uniref:hypothetical protein n=1 Tax=Pseudonocardia sulfidoxydans TaxID=54011 RepID=UPI00361D91DF